MSLNEMAALHPRNSIRDRRLGFFHSSFLHDQDGFGEKAHRVSEALLCGGKNEVDHPRRFVKSDLIEAEQTQWEGESGPRNRTAPQL